LRLPVCSRKGTLVCGPRTHAFPVRLPCLRSCAAAPRGALGTVCMHVPRNFLVLLAALTPLIALLPPLLFFPSSMWVCDARRGLPALWIRSKRRSNHSTGYRGDNNWGQGSSRSGSSRRCRQRASGRRVLPHLLAPGTRWLPSNAVCRTAPGMVPRKMTWFGIPGMQSRHLMEKIQKSSQDDRAPCGHYFPGGTRCVNEECQTQSPSQPCRRSLNPTHLPSFGPHKLLGKPTLLHRRAGPVAFRHLCPLFA